MTVNCAHRGASAEAPENTLAAFALAVEQGARMIELDVRLSLDGFPVVVHDGTLERTTNGKGRVEDTLLDDLRALDAGRWFDARYGGEKIPLLSEAIDFAHEHGLRLDIEMKFTRGSVYPLCDAVGAVIDKAGFVDGCIVTSFNHGSLNYLKKRFPQVSIARLYGTHAPRDRDLKDGVTSAAVNHMFVVPSLVKRIHRHGGQLHVWTVDDPNEMRRMVRMGVDTLMTNRPAVLGRVLAEMAEGEGAIEKK
jgi:glycerophosphoryl diester phosphodiesterase